MTPESVCWLTVLPPETALTVIVRARAGGVLQVVAPESVRAAPPKLPSVRLVFALARMIGLVGDKGPVALIDAEGALTFNLPTPKLALFPRINPPAWRSMPMLLATPKVLALLSCRMPAPVLTMLAVGVVFEMTAVTVSVGVKGEMTEVFVVPSRVTALTANVWAVEPRSSKPARVEGAAMLLEEAVTPFVSVSVPVVVTVGLVALPRLLKVRELRVLFPANVSVEALLSVTSLAGSICPALVVMVTVAPLIVRPPLGISATPAVMLAADGVAPVSVKVPPLTTVPPL